MSRKARDGVRGARTGAAVVILCTAGTVRAQEATELAHLVQNPIAKVISLPFQDNLAFGVGPRAADQNVLNIQPVLPVSLGRNWNLISRAIIPVIDNPSLAAGGEGKDGLGDISLALYLSPAATSGGVIWGIGPAFTFASASDRALGQGKLSVGGSAVALTIQGHWLIGTLVTDVASVAGDSYRKSVHQMLVQPFINYNFPHGWYLTSSPIVTANWQAPGSQQWTVPLGGGGGRTFRIGRQAFNMSLQAFGNVVRPPEAGNWTLRAQVQLIFPK